MSKVSPYQLGCVLSPLVCDLVSLSACLPVSLATIFIFPAKSHRYEKALAACKESLEKLGTEYIDLYLIHWPGMRGTRHPCTVHACSVPVPVFILVFAFSFQN